MLRLNFPFLKCVWYSEGENKYELAGKCQRDIYVKKYARLEFQLQQLTSTIELNFQILCKYYQHNSIIWN